MRIRVLLTGSVLSRLGEKLELEWYREEDHPDAWRFDPEDRDALARAKSFLESHVQPEVDDEPVGESVVFEQLEEHDPDEFDHLAILGLADTHVNADVSRPWDALVKCPSCRNLYVDPEFEPPILSKKLPRKAGFFNLDGRLKLFARKTWIEEYDKAGLTGVSFAEHPTVPELFKVRIEQHVWCDRCGVCDHCGMKTNVVGGALFNLMEVYRFDFQFLRLNPGQKERAYHVPFVVTPRAMRFAAKHSSVAGHMRFCLAPSIPGLMQDLIWPRNEVFCDGKWPTTVYRRADA